MSSPRRVLLFGDPVLEHDGRREPIVGAQKALALLTYLIHQDEPVRRGHLAALLWGETSDYRSRRNLTHVLGQIAARLPGCVLADHLTVGWHPQAPVWVDVHACGELLAPTLEPQALPELTARAAALAQVTELYRGELLAGFALDDSPEFEAWLARERERWRQRVVVTLDALAEHYRQHGQSERAERTLRRRVELEPWHEEGYRALMRLLAVQGRRGEALATYERCCRILAAELGLTPSSETVALAEQIRGGDPRHTQPGPGQITVAATSLNSPAPPQPGAVADVPPSTLLARDDELATLRRWFASPECRVMTITGIGGVGKSSLAAAAVAQIAAHGHPVVWCSLIDAPALEDVMRHCLHTLGAPPARAVSAASPELIAALVEQLQARPGLIVLDNAESLLDATRTGGGYRPGREDYRELFAALAATPHQGLMLVTSRELLPDVAPASPMLHLGGLSDKAASVLLEQAGLRGTPGARLALARRYGGIPLALKLAAALIHDLFGGTIEAFLQAGAPLMGGVRSLLDEQLARLTLLERQALLWLAVERGPVEPATIAASLAHLGGRAAVLEALQRLVRCSLVERQDGALLLHSVVLEYATELLITACCAELEQGRLELLQSHPLLHARAPEHVRQAQARMLLAPIVDQLLARLGRAGLEGALARALAALRTLPARSPGYGAANLLQLMLHAGIDARGTNLSDLCVWQADLRRAALPQVAFAGADLRGTAFADTFDRPLSLAISPDGSLLAAGTVEGQIQLWHTRTWQPDRVFTSGNAFVAALAFSPDGLALASNGPEQSLLLWDVSSGQPSRRLVGHQALIYTAVFSPDGQTLASGSHDGAVRLWDCATGLERRRLIGHEGAVWQLAFHPSGQTLASASLDGTVGIWDVTTGDLRERHGGHTGRVQAVAFTPDGASLASGDAGGTILLWDTDTWQVRVQLAAHTSVIHTLAFSPDGDVLASASDDRSIRLWNAATGQLSRLLAGHYDFVRSVAFSPDGQTLISGGGDQTVRIWNLAEGRIVETLYGHTGMLLAVAATGDGALACGGVDGRIVRWGGDGFPRRPLAGHQGWLRALAATPDRRLLASGGDDQVIRLWDAEHERVRAELHGHADGVYGLAFSPDGLLLASTSQDLTVRIWDVAAGRQCHILRRHRIRARTVAFSPDGASLASCGADGLIALWDVASGQHLGDLEGHSGWVSSVAYCPRSGVLVSGGMDQVVRVWVPEATTPRMLSGHTSAVNRVLVTADGATIISAGFDRVIRLWDCARGTPVGELHGHTAAVADLTLVGANTLASVDVEGSVRLWDLSRGACAAVRQVEGRYAGMRIDGASGLSPAQRAALIRLGAMEPGASIDDEPPVEMLTLGAP
ncbi:MAG: hypothetical protein HGA45_12895 [Chloroflexales bacterium]|nr:hypothetical protein [Chloroflexales bacterium]